MAKQAQQPVKEKKEEPKIIKKEPVVVEPKKEAPAIKTAPIDKDIKKELQKQQRQFQLVEEKMATLNGQKSVLEAALSAPDTYADKNKFVETETAYKKVQDDLRVLNKEYEKLFELVMQLEEKMRG